MTLTYLLSGSNHMPQIQSIVNIFKSQAQPVSHTPISVQLFILNGNKIHISSLYKGMYSFIHIYWYR